MIEYISKEVTRMLMEDYGWDMRTAMNTFMTSHTYTKLERPGTGLYYQSPVYIYGLLSEELRSA